MDYERIELLSRKLYNPRIETRLRTANSILFKLECGILLKDDMKFSSCISILLDGISNSFAITLRSCSENDLLDNKKEAYQLVSLLLSIAQYMTKIPNKFSFTSACSNVLNNLYQMKTMQSLDSKLSKLIDETIASICSLGETKESLELQQMHNDELLQAKICVQNENDLENFHNIQGNKIGYYHGAGAILNSRFVYHGWKFPDFVITEYDERYLFDVEVRVKLQHDSASRDIWDVLSNFPVEAIMKKTNLLHAIIDIVGGPFSKRDIDTNPSGLNPLVALKWLEVLLLKCHHAFSVQLDGSICCRTLNTELYNSNNNNNRIDPNMLDIPDVSMKLAEAMYALRHPILPPRTSNSSVPIFDGYATENKYDMFAKMALLPLPSYTGLAFACCAAAMPLLQTRDTDIARSVFSVLEAALPYIMEPGFQKTDSHISDIECGRFQHILNRLEQILSFFGTHFEFHCFLTLVYSDDDEANTDEVANMLKDFSFELIFLSTVILIFGALPSESIFPSSKFDDGLSRKLKVGSCTTASLHKIAACKSLWKFLPHNTKEVIAKTLHMLDESILTTISNLHQAIQCSEVFLSANTWSESPEKLLNQLINAAEIVSELLDESCSLCESTLLEKAKLSLCASLPIMLIACEENTNEDQYVEKIITMLLRILTCSTRIFKSCLVMNILMYTRSSHSYNSQESSSINQLQFEMASRFCIEPPVVHHYLIATLAKPQMIHALLVLGYFQSDFESEQDVFLNILNNISEYLIAANELFSIPETFLLSWAKLLPPLKLLEWNPNITYSEKTAIADFTRLLHDRCAICNCFQSRLIFAKCLIMGLFHFDNNVRIASTLSIQRDLFQIESAVGTTQSTDIEVYDIFSKRSHIQLHQIDFTVCSVSQPRVESKIKKTHLPTSSLKATAKSSFTHADIRKVASIGCNHELDASIRVSAMVQLLEMLQSDSQLIRTVDISWVTNVTKECLETLKKLIPFQFTVGASTLTIDKLHEISDSTCRLLILVMKIAILFISQIKTLKELLSFYYSVSSNSSNPNSVISLDVLLKLLLVNDVTNSKIFDNTWSQTLQILRYLSAQLFFMLCCSIDNWTSTSFNTKDGKIEYGCDSLKCGEVKEKGKEEEDTTQDLFLIPSFLIKTLLYPASKYVETTNEYHKSLDIISQKLANPKQVKIICYYKNGNNREFPINELAHIVLSDFTYPSVDRIYVAASTKFFGMIVDARNHVNFREALSSILCIFQANSSLLQVFLDLKISLVTAVSNIVTINPRTHKDHITLSSVILFMNSILQCMKTIYGLKITSIPECLEFFQDILDAVLPNIALYFKTHGKLSISSESSSQFGSDEKTTDKEYINITSFVRTAYLKLLLTITSFCDPDQHLLLGELLSGNYIIYYSYSIACSELHSGWDRYLAISILDNLVRFHNGYDTLLRCASDSNQSEEKNRDDILMIESLIRMIRLLRTPDSMLGTSALVGGLKLLYSCLNHAKTYQPLFFNSKQLNQNWSWLSRLMYDRRTEVKLLALDIVGLALNNNSELNDIVGLALNNNSELNNRNTLNISDDSLDVSPKQSLDEENIFSNPTSSSNYSWPPFEVLQYIVTDTNESVSLRSKAVDILVRELIFKEFYKESVNKLGNILSFVSSCLSIDQDFSSAISIQWALDIVLNLLGINESNEKLKNISSIRSESIALIRVLKIPQQITELLDSSVKECLTRASLARVGLVEDNYISFHKDTFNHLTDFAISRNQVHHLVLEGSGWSQLQQKFQSLEYNMLKSISASICCFFFQVNKYEPELLKQSIKYSNIIFLAFSNFSEINEKYAQYQETKDLIFNFGNISAQAELLSLFIADQSLVFKKLMQEHELIPINVLTSVALAFEQIIEIFKNKVSVQLELVLIQCLNSCLRLLNILVNDSICFVSLGLSNENYKMIETLKYVFLQLFELRSNDIFEIYSQQIKIELISRIDLTIAHFMQYNIEARELFIIACKRQCSRHVEQKHKEFPSLFHEYISTIVTFIELISNVSSATYNETSTEIQKSLQKLKTKRALDHTSAKKKLNQSTSSLGTITTASQPSKWRIKNRSYIWNSDREQNLSLKSSKAPEAPSSSMKLQLWTALIVLSHCFPNCKEAIDWAIDLKLPVYLSKLLRYANRYTLSTVFHFSSSVQGDVFGDIDSKWIPSNGMISAAICSLCCAFSYENLQAKLNFACSGEAPAVVLNDLGGTQSPSPGNSNGTSLHQLVAMGISRSTIPVIRWLCLSLAGSLLSCSRSVVLGNPALKSTFTQIITLSLQRSMHASSSDPESVLHLVNTLTCLMSSDEDILHIIQLCSKDDSTQLQLSLSLIKDMSSKPSDIPLGNFKLITFPELMQWIWSKTGKESNIHNIELIVAICRCLGRISVIDKKNKTIGNIMSESMLSILCECFQSINNNTVIATSAVTLWNIVHQSEKAKCIVREQLRSRNNQQHSVTQLKNKENNLNHNIHYSTDVEGSVVQAKLILDSLLNA